ncbi:MAG: amylo-alpha-1,6-glucosidase, partial [Candidatus Kryptoniota bacterium]
MIKNIAILILAGLLILSGTSYTQIANYKGNCGQIEVGGNYVGAEFHHGRPLPSRISFYYPVANSIDLSTDYWKRDESRPFNVIVSVDGKTDTIGVGPCSCSWTPYEADFTVNGTGWRARISYQFCDDLPFMVVRMQFVNLTRGEKTFHVKTGLLTILRTCQTYAWRDSAQVMYIRGGDVYMGNFRYADTDSASVLIVNAGELLPTKLEGEIGEKLESAPEAKFNYLKSVRPFGEFTITQLIGSCRIGEAYEMVGRVLNFWRESVEKNRERILHYVHHEAVIKVPDENLERTALWSKAMLATDRHYIDGRVVPMPCPAEYNFFFTHDVLVTDLGAVFYDLSRVRNDLLFIRSLMRSDSVLPHAYYWRDDGFKTEFASADNWNHLWFMIVCGTYLKHSNDVNTIRLVYPALRKSVNMALSNLGPDGLMYSTRPDWWDIGNNYGARSYLTALMVRALREYCYVALKLGIDQGFATELLSLSNTLQKNLVLKLWNSRAAYLLNTLDTNSVDYHYYAGALVAVDFDLLDRNKSDSLIATAQRELLDNNLGIRNAMPDDFDRLSSLYSFKGGEAGGPYIYMNGAVWPQTTAWYILGLIQLGKVNLARESLRKYLSLEGIKRSPNGQASFFEYRFSDPSSPFYGKIDKPNFLWAGGWYLNSLYHLAGVRENEWNIYFTPEIPDGFNDMEYDLTFKGRLSRILWKGSGDYFKKIVIGNKDLHSAVLYKGAGQILIERGRPEAPYLESVSCVVNSVGYSNSNNTLAVQLRGFLKQDVSISIVSPEPLKKAMLGNEELTSRAVITEKGGVYTIKLRFSLNREVK